MAERVLITGGAGFIGAHLAHRLLAEGAEVTLLDDLSRGRPDESLRPARLVRHDLTEPVPPNLLTGDFDVVYHLAAVVGVQRANDEPGRVLRTNILATSNLLDWCDRSGPGAVFLSSTSEFADGAARLGLTSFPTAEQVPFALADPRSPRSSYALSKAVAESMLLHRADSTRVRIGRYFNVYGPRMGYSHVIPQFIRRLLAGHDPFAVYGAHQTRAFCHVQDAVAATVALTRRPDGGPLIVNIGNDREELPIIELAQRLFALAGRAPRVEIHDPPAGSPDRRLPDLTALRALVGSAEPVPLTTGLREMLDWYTRDAA